METVFSSLVIDKATEYSLHVTVLISVTFIMWFIKTVLFHGRLLNEILESVVT